MVDQWIKNNAEWITHNLEMISSQEEGEGPLVLAQLAIGEAYLYGYISALKNTLTIEDMGKLDKQMEEINSESTYCHYLYVKKNVGSIELNLF